MNISVNLSSEIKAAKEKKALNKPFRTSGGPKKFAVYVKNEKGNIVKVNFGDPNMEIKRDDPNRRKNFRARHQCDTNPGPRWKARYWSCKMWESKKGVSDHLSKGSVDEVVHQWDGITYWDQTDLLKIAPHFAKAEEIIEEIEASTMAEEAYEMALGQLAFISETAKNLWEKLKLNDGLMHKLEPWTLSKITIVEDYLASVHNYVLYSQEDENDKPEMEEEDNMQVGARVMNVNASCKHFASEGLITEIKELPDNMGKVVSYEVVNDGQNYKKGDILTKTIDQLQALNASYNSPREGSKTNWLIRYRKNTK